MATAGVVLGPAGIAPGAVDGKDAAAVLASAPALVVPRPPPEVMRGRLAATAVAAAAAGAENADDGEVEGPASCEPSGTAEAPETTSQSLHSLSANVTTYAMLKGYGLHTLGYTRHCRLAKRPHVPQHVAWTASSVPQLSSSLD